MKFNRLAVLFSLFAVVLLLVYNRPVYSQQDNNQTSNLSEQIKQKQQELNQIKQKIKDLYQKIKKTRKTKKTLANQIAYYDTQIKLTEYKIRQLEKEIEILTQSINLLGNKINILDVSLDKMENVLRARLIQEYKLSKLSTATFLSGKSFNYGVSLKIYLTRLAQADQRMIGQLKQVKTQFANQKDLKQQKKDQLGKIKKALAAQERALASQQAEKQKLLQLTKGDEKRYQEMLATLKAEQENIANAVNKLLSSIGTLENGQQVKKGDVIGQQGSTGKVWPKDKNNPAVGSHLHFMVLKCPSGSGFDYYKCAVNPEPYLSNPSFVPPLDSWRKTQGFGPASCSFYSRCFHYGYDMVNYHGAPIYAIADGEVFYGIDSAGGKFAVIKHSDTFYSAYWHLK
ncbi:MAG: hypothetical protein GXP43_03005 [bacterium]|nr:hypothetical protein [bacterium]